MKLQPGFSKGRVLAILMIASLAAPFLGSVVAGPLRGLARIAIAPVGDGAMAVVAAFNSYVLGASAPAVSSEDARDLLRHNKVLQAEVAYLAAQLARTKRHLLDIQYIRDHYYGPIDDMPCELIPARVVAGDSLPFSRTRILSVGERSGAGKGMLATTRAVLTNRSKALPAKLAAITASALVGRITEAGPYTSRLQLVTDMGFEIPCTIRRVVAPGRKRRITVMKGAAPSVVNLTIRNADVETTSYVSADGKGGMVVRQVKELHKVEVGDQLFTCLDDPLVRARIPIGEVTGVEDDPDRPGLFVTLRVQPQADLAALRDIYVIIPPKGGS